MVRIFSAKKKYGKDTAVSSCVGVEACMHVSYSIDLILIWIWIWIWPKLMAYGSYDVIIVIKSWCSKKKRKRDRIVNRGDGKTEKKG